MSNLSLRLVTAAIGIPALLAINYAGGPVFAALAGATGVVAAIEMYDIIRKAGFRPVAPPGAGVTAIMAMLPFLTSPAESAWVAALLALILAGAGIYLIPRVYGRNMASWALTILPAAYVGLCLGHLSALRTWDKGAWWVATLLVITWAYDTGAFAAGRLYGRHPFMAHVSPKKTVEGVIGGLVAASLGALLAVPALGLAPWQAVLLGFVGGAGAQLGDLIESMLKREAGVKDSGAIVPGHGGLLDRIDSLLLTSIAVYYAARLFGHAA